MTEYEDIMANIADDDSDSSDNDTDEELKEAFAAGIIKPGLNYMGEAPEKKVAKNNIPAMKQKIAEFKKNLPWVCVSFQSSIYLIVIILDRKLRSDKCSSSPCSRTCYEGRFTREGEGKETKNRQGEFVIIFCAH